jgi:hypothetical protein
MEHAQLQPDRTALATAGGKFLNGHRSDTRVSMSPQPPQDGRWAIFVPVSYKNMALGDSQLFDGMYNEGDSDVLDYY